MPNDEVQHWMVFGSTRRPLMGGGSYLDWGSPPIGVYPATDPQEAMKAAAVDASQMGTFVAVPCVASVPGKTTTALGRTANTAERMEQAMQRMEQREETILQLAEKVNNGR